MSCLAALKVFHVGRICRDILNTCIRNTEEAERAVQTSGSGRGLGKGIWNMIEESELAKSIKKEDSGKVRSCSV